MSVRTFPTRLVHSLVPLLSSVEFISGPSCRSLVPTVSGYLFTRLRHLSEEETSGSESRGQFRHLSQESVVENTLVVLNTDKTPDRRTVLTEGG